MGKHKTKQEKLEIIEYWKVNGLKSTTQKYSISKSRLTAWRKELFDNTLSNSKSGLAKGLGQGRPKKDITLDIAKMSRKELEEYARALQLLEKYQALQGKKDSNK